MKRKSRVGLIIGLIILALAVTGVVIYYYSGTSADSIEAIRGTNVQLVDEKGESVKKQVPVTLVFSGTIRSCKVTRVFGAKFSGCKTVNKTFGGVALTDETGVYTASVSSYRKLTKDELYILALSLMSDNLDAPLSAQEQEFIRSVINELAGIENPTQAQVTAVIDAKLKNSASIIATFHNSALMPFVLYNPIFALGLATGTQEHGFKLLNVTASVKTSLITSDLQTISFYTTDYKPSVNLTLKYNGVGLLTAAKDAYFTQVDGTTATDIEKEAIKTSITGFVDYVPYYMVHIVSEDEFSDVMRANAAKKASTSVAASVEAVAAVAH